MSKFERAVLTLKQYFLAPPKDEHEMDDCPLSALENLGLSKRQCTKAMKAAFTELMQEGYLICQDEHGDFKAVALDDAPPDVRRAFGP